MKKLNQILEKIIKYRYFIAVFIFIFLVIFKIHGSSISMWDNYIKDKQNVNEKTLIMGKERAIRSDEWLVQTPMYLSQSMSKEFYPLYNDNIRSDGQNMLLYGYCPVFDISILGKPFNWGFLFLDKERAFSWYWNLKWIMLFLVSFELCSILTKKDKSLSVLGAVWITFSSPIQWWFSTFVVDLFVYAQLLVVSFYYYINSRKNLKKRILSAIIFTISTMGYVLTLYPPIQVPLGYLVLILMLWILISSIKKHKIKMEKIDIFIIIIYLSINIFNLVNFYLNSKESLNIMMNTVYPGKRFVIGGGLNFKVLFYYLISFFLPFKDSTILNNCEISNFVNFIPAILISYIYMYKKQNKPKKIITVLFAYLMFCISWLVIQYPKFLAKVTLFSYVTEARLLIVIGITAIYLILIFMKSISEKKIFGFKCSVILSFIITIVNAYVIYSSFMLKYLKIRYSLFILCLFFILNLLFFTGNKKMWSFIMIVVMIISGILVNPIEKGLGSIYNKKLSKEILKIENKNPRSNWIALNSGINGQFLIANGVKSINSVHVYPDIYMWEKIDKNKKYKKIYNRYAHITIQLTKQKTEFILDAPDAFTVRLNLNDLEKINVKYILSTENLSKYKSEKLIFYKIYFNKLDSTYIYRIDYK